MDTDQGRRAVAKAARRFVPFLTLCYIVASLDRVNISFAAPTMSKDLALNATLYGWAAGIFFLTYTVCEVPSNLMLVRFGARRWIARIMITWGILSALTALASGPTSLIVLRFLLGAAEAGFFPGIIVFMAHWFPNEYRGRMTAAFLLAVPLSNGLGAIVSAPFLAMDGFLGLHGWQWLFIAEGIPAAVLGVIVFFFLVDSPEKASWLSADEKQWLRAKLDAEVKQAAHGRKTFLQAVTDGRVLGLSAIWLLRTICLYGVTFFLPQMIEQSQSLASVVAIAIPSTVGALVMLLWARSSDRMRERRWHLVVAFLAIIVGFLGMAHNDSLPSAVFFLSLAAIGYSAVAPCLWAIPPTFLSGSAAAGGVAFINAIGYCGGLLGPVIVGWTKDQSGSFQSGFYALAAVALIGMILTYLTVPGRGRQTSAIPSSLGKEQVTGWRWRVRSKLPT
ncbi:MFS transporter [Bradyrhizobium sp. Ai1a-2]|uniref:MFS transporter n=1 Tax=Bradyrhizobium sp. Ai1a-2 TaxID=196490 RepID=UPI000403E545|nr:MFS transporter [Bradyrhizobium sp. Ai1a-2]